MSEWGEYILGQAISGDECYFVPRYPRHVAHAFIVVSYDDDNTLEENDTLPYQRRIEMAIQRFAQRWGGLDDLVFVRVLHEATRRRDRLAAIFAVGANSAMTDAEALALLEPLLRSSDQLERCAAACMFALRRDERAIPVLEEYLLHEPPKDEDGQYVVDASVWYYSERSRIARLLASWGPPSVIPTLRQAFLHLLALEEDDGANVYDQDAQDALCYALGWRGALSAFHGVELPEQRRRIALVRLALGYVQADERFDHLSSAILLDRGLQQELVEVLMEHFALSEEESQQIVSGYLEDIEQRRHATYGIEWDDTPVIVKDGEAMDEDGEAIDISTIKSEALKTAIRLLQARQRNHPSAPEEAEQ